MNKIVNGVANDYEFPMYYESNIKTSRDKDSVIAMTYVNQEKEIERLNNIINELEKWLEEKQMITGINHQGFSWGVAGDCLDKLKELKGDKE